MANEEHLEIMKSGVEAWNEWRNEKKDVVPNLRLADLRGANLRGVNLGGAGLHGADLSGTDLRMANLIGSDLGEAYLEGANLRGADLRSANLSGANLVDTNLSQANFFLADFSNANLIRASLRMSDLNSAVFSEADLMEADLMGANLIRTDLNEANLTGVSLYETTLADVDLTDSKGLDDCSHLGPSIVDHRTLQRSKNVPIKFWHGCGLPNRLIEHMLSLSDDATEYYSCFISYSSMDQEFADRLHADLQNAGVRCWFAPHDLPIGKKILDGLDEAVRMRDKVLIILSDDAIESGWVEDEVTMAFEEEHRRKETMLFPIRLDDAVMETGEAWARKLRARNIGDFTRWKDHDAYMEIFDRVLRDLKVEG